MPNTRVLVTDRLTNPGWNSATERHGMSHNAASTLVDQLNAETRAATYREAADLVAPESSCKCGPCTGLREKAELFRAKADQIDPTT